MDLVNIVSILFIFIEIFSTSSADVFESIPEVKQELELQYKYAVVVDCGSSGSRGHIFRWPASNLGENGSATAQAEPMRDQISGKPLIKRISPGLSSFKDNPEQASNYMHPIMDFLSKNIPVVAQRETPVYFMASAGLRLLSNEQQSRILEDIAHDLKLEYNFPRLFTQVISGQQEGAYQWFTINAHASKLGLDFDQYNKNFFCQAPRSRRYGLIEMGGASVQVSFELVPELISLISGRLRHSYEALRAFHASQIDLRLPYGRIVKLFATSFAGFGSDSARSSAIDLLVRDFVSKIAHLSGSNNSNHSTLDTSNLTNSTLILEDPCLPLGGREQVEKPVQLLYNPKQTLGYTSQSDGDNFKIILLGSGSFSSCRNLLIRLIYTAKRERLFCEANDCALSLIGTNFVPFRYFKILGLSDLYYTTKEMLEADGQIRGPILFKRLAVICSTSYEELLRKYPNANSVNPKRVLLECFKGLWIMDLLQFVFRYNFRTEFETTGSINNNDLDWTLGALISKLASESQAINLSGELMSS